MSDIADAQPHAIKERRCAQAWFAHHLGKRLRVRAIGAGLVWSHGARRRVEGHQHAWWRLYQCQAAGKRLAGNREGRLARAVDNDNARLQADGGKRAQVIRDAHSLRDHVGIARDLCINGQEIVLAFELEGVTAQVNEGDGVRPGLGGLFQKIAKRATQTILVKIARADNLEGCSLQRLRDQARIIGGRLQRPRLVGRIAQDQSNSFLGRLGGRARIACRNNQRTNRKETTEELLHDSTMGMMPIPSEAA